MKHSGSNHLQAIRAPCSCCYSAIDGGRGINHAVKGITPFRGLCLFRDSRCIDPAFAHQIHREMDTNWNITVRKTKTDKALCITTFMYSYCEIARPRMTWKAGVLLLQNLVIQSVVWDKDYLFVVHLVLVYIACDQNNFHWRGDTRISSVFLAIP